MSSSSQTHPSTQQLPRELWCDITARILGDYLYDLIIGPHDTTEWDAITTLLHTSSLVRSCTHANLSFLSHSTTYRPLIAHLRALRDEGIDALVLSEWDYAPGARFFGLPSSLAAPLSMSPVVVLARLRHTLAASYAFAREGYDWFPYNAPEVYHDVACTALLVETYGKVPAYVRYALLWRTVERIAALQVARITWAIEKTRSRFEMTQGLLGAKRLGHVAHPAAKTSSEDLLVSVRHMLATELNITL